MSATGTRFRILLLLVFVTIAGTGCKGFMWGLNTQGQLGDGTVGDGTSSTRFAPLRIGAASNWESLGLGSAFSCATKAGGQLWCWGLNTFGQLGDTTNFDHSTPERIGASASWSSVDGGYNHTAGIQRAL